MIKVSVIMPAFNAERYIREAIESILTQSFQHFEFLIYNDGSTDKTADIIKSYNDERIRFFDYTENFGYVNHLNNGIAIAKGKYIARMDADDISHVERLQKQVTFMEANPEVGICGTWYDIIEDPSNIIKIATEHDDLKLGLLFNSVFGHPSVLMRADLFCNGALIYEEGFMPAEDFRLWVELSKICKLANLSEVLLHYRRHEGQISNYKKQLQIEKIKAVRELQIEYLLEHKLAEEDRSAVDFLFGLKDDVVYNANFFNKVLKFSVTLIQINSNKRVYDGLKLEAVLFDRVKTLLYNTKYNKSLLFVKSKSFLLNKLSVMDRFKFYLKCILNWQPTLKC